MLPHSRLALFAALTVAAVTLPRVSAAQSTEDSKEWLARCQDERGDDEGARYCEVRDTTIAVTGSLDVDARENGSVSVHAWDQNSIRLVAHVQAHARSDADARALAKEISIDARGGRIRADGPSSSGYRTWWSVSYELYVPRKTDLDVRAENGSISVADITGRMQLQTVNGGLRLSNLAGDVRAETTNGSIAADLTGRAWSGDGFDAETTNGSVRLTMPNDYSARLETGTVNGSLNIDFPVTVQGRLTRTISTTLGSGGALIRARTTNGGVSIRKA